MPLLPPDDQYQSKLNDAFKTHVADQMRKSDHSIPADATPDEILEANYRHTKRAVPDVTDEEYNQTVEDKYRPSFEAPKKSLGETVGPIVHGAGRVASGLAHGLAESVASPATAIQAKLQGGQLESTMNKMKAPDIGDLRSKGYSDEQIHNIVKGYTDTQQSLAGDVEEMGKTGVKSTAEALATYGTLPLGGAKAGLEAGAKSLLKEGASSLLGKAAVHAAEGGIIGGAYGTVKGGIQAGADAAAQGDGAGQIFGKMVHGAAHEGLTNAAAGVALGGVGSVIGQGGKSLLFGRQMAREAAQQAAQEQATRAAAALAFDRDFHPSYVGERFSADVALATQNKTPDAVLASQIVGKLLNTTPEEADPALVQVMLKKITQYKAQNAVMGEGIGAKMFPEVELPPVSEGVQPAGQRVPLATDLTEPVGGQAPDQTPPGVAEPSVPPAPVAGAAPAGLEPGMPTPAAAPPGMDLSGVAPEESPLSPMPLRTPLPLENSVGQPTPEGVTPEAQPQPQAMPPQEPTPAPAPAPQPIGQAAGQALPQDLSRTTPFAGPETPSNPEGTPPAGATPPVVKPQASLAPPRLPGASGPTKNPTEANFAMTSLGKPTGQPGWQSIGDVAYRTSVNEQNNAVELNYLENLGDEKGAGAAVLKKLTKTADEHQVPMTLNALPLPRGNGKGRIPLDKLVEFYKKHGFEVTDEGDGWADMRREPVPVNKVSPETASSLKEQGDGVADRIEGLTDDRAKVAAGNVVEGQKIISAPKSSFVTRLDDHLGRISDAAAKRLTAAARSVKLGGGLGALDPSVPKDLAIMVAAKMFQLGIRSTTKVTNALIDAHGEWVKPLIKKALEGGRNLLMRLIASDKPTTQQLNEIKRMYDVGAVGKGWYDNTWSFLQKHFGDDAEMMGRFIAATSYGNSTEGNATMALRAYGQWKLGLPFDATLSKAQSMSLLRATRGEVFGDGKAQGFLGAITGDPNALALDRHVMRVLGFKNAGKASGRSALSNSTYRLYSSILTDLAKEKGVTPREYQAALWTAPKIEGIQAEHAAGENIHRTGSFRPMEDLLGKRLGGLTPSEWVEQNEVTHQKLANASEGVQRARLNGGHSFNPTDFSEFHKPGFIVTLDHKVMPVGEASGTQVLKFASRYRDLTDKYHGVVIGMYKNGDDMHIDFNVHIPDHPANEALSKQLGLEGRQYAVGHVSQTGQYRDVSTGYDPAVHGPQFEQRPLSEIDAQMQHLGIPSKDDASQLSLFHPPIEQETGGLRFDPEVHEQAVKNPAMALSIYGDVAKKSPTEIKDMINSGKFKPMTDAGVAGAVVVNKDGVVWQYVDPEAPSYNTMKALGTLRGKNMPAMLDKLKGLEILRGHDVVESYRNQAGYVSLRRGLRPETLERVKQDAQGAVFTKMMNTGGSIVPASELIGGGSSPYMNSYWLTPTGRVVRSTMTHAGQARAMKISGVRGYSGTDGSAGASVQTLLNLGFVRVQASGKHISFDSGAALSPAQREIVRKASVNKDFWAGQVTDEKGKLVSYFSSNDNKIHHYLAAAGEEKQ